MGRKSIRFWVAIIFDLLCCATIASTAESDGSSKNIIKEPPIIIHTVAQNYENPSLEGYHLCIKNQESCRSKCSLLDEACKEKCPICPILVDQDVYVQGINDTQYQPPLTKKVNQTNIIHVRTGIKNIIDFNAGNITARSHNNIHIYQNRTSRTGGKFGLGYSENGPCCHVIGPRRCTRHLQLMEPICRHRRRRTCGTHCTSRVMRYSKQTVPCNDENTDNCLREMGYIPVRRRPGCRYTNSYPYVSCRRRQARRLGCSHCYRLPVMYLMRGLASFECAHCFGRANPFYRPAPMPVPMYYGGYGYPPMLFDDNWAMDEHVEPEDLTSDVKIEYDKCRNANGSIIDNCVTLSMDEHNPEEDHTTSIEEADYEDEDQDADADAEYD